ncbi:hypothetical protein LMG29542_04430 [Paraburkholderia humisilvae]|uniref:Uncharacterized protein n=1 Tax=Paraburkholderia humisilvae TaxID=627669 RepID=A0A6J5E858_9BURK|nr:hypothetical protein LMG29542_04430 [Paraburkholderia humisilvae]
MSIFLVARSSWIARFVCLTFEIKIARVGSVAVSFADCHVPQAAGLPPGTRAGCDTAGFLKSIHWNEASMGGNGGSIVAASAFPALPTMKMRSGIRKPRSLSSSSGPSPSCVRNT